MVQRSSPPMPNAVRLLEEVPPHALPGELARRAADAAGCGVGLYVVDIGGSALRRIAGSTRLPGEVEVPQVAGPELPRGRMGEVQLAFRERLAGAVAVPLWSRDRAVAVFVAEREPKPALEPLARQAAAAVELADRYTDVFSRARRRRPTTAAAELQENLLAPRVARLDAVEVGAGIVPAYEVGGDWYDYVQNPDGTWVAIADAVGKGPKAAALAAVGLGALRAARRAGRDLEQTARAMDEAVAEVADAGGFLTAVLGCWQPARRAFSWAAFGHPQPLRMKERGDVEDLTGAVNPPLGLLDEAPDLRFGEVSLRPHESVVLYSDGVTERRTESGHRFGLPGIEQALASAADRSASALVSALVAAVIAARAEAPRDDATVLVLSPH